MSDKPTTDEMIRAVEHALADRVMTLYHLQEMPEQLRHVYLVGIREATRLLLRYCDALDEALVGVDNTVEKKPTGD